MHTEKSVEENLLSCGEVSMVNTFCSLNMSVLAKKKQKKKKKGGVRGGDYKPSITYKLIVIHS